MKALRVTIASEVVLQTLWYDEQWHEELLRDGFTEDEALREMLRVGWEEDWSSLVSELLCGGHWPPSPSAFLQAVKSVEVIERVVLAQSDSERSAHAGRPETSSEGCQPLRGAQERSERGAAGSL